MNAFWLLKYTHIPEIGWEWESASHFIGIAWHFIQFYWSWAHCKIVHWRMNVFFLCMCVCKCVSNDEPLKWLFAFIYSLDPWGENAPPTSRLTQIVFVAVDRNWYYVTQSHLFVRNFCDSVFICEFKRWWSSICSHYCHFRYLFMTAWCMSSTCARAFVCVWTWPQLFPSNLIKLVWRIE